MLTGQTTKKVDREGVAIKWKTFGNSIFDIYKTGKWKTIIGRLQMNIRGRDRYVESKNGC